MICRVGCSARIPLLSSHPAHTSYRSITLCTRSYLASPRVPRPSCPEHHDATHPRPSPSPPPPPPPPPSIVTGSHSDPRRRALWAFAANEQLRRRDDRAAVARPWPLVGVGDAARGPSSSPWLVRPQRWHRGGKHRTVVRDIPVQTSGRISRPVCGGGAWGCICMVMGMYGDVSAGRSCCSPQDGPRRKGHRGQRVPTASPVWAECPAACAPLWAAGTMGRGVATPLRTSPLAVCVRSGWSLRWASRPWSLWVFAGLWTAAAAGCSCGGMAVLAGSTSHSTSREV